MGACRQSMNVWFYLKNFLSPPKWTNRRAAIKNLFGLQINKTFWHDSFGRYFNRWVFCPRFGHKNVRWLSDGGCEGDRPKHYCFDCEQEVDPGIDKIRAEVIKVE